MKVLFKEVLNLYVVDYMFVLRLSGTHEYRSDIQNFSCANRALGLYRIFYYSALI